MNTHSQYRYVEYIKLAIVGMHYAPYILSLDLNGSAGVYVAFGIYITASMALRNLYLADRLSVHLRGGWVLADTVIWLIGQWLTGWIGMTAVALILGTDAAMNGWRYKRGLPHLLVEALILLAGVWLTAPGPISETQWHFFLFQAAVGFAFVHAFVYMATTVREANAELREYATKVEEITVLRERNRIAREVHDTIAHAFTGIIMQLEAVRFIMEDEPATAAQRLDIVQEKARESLGELRRSVHALRPLHLEERHGLQALSKLVEDFHQSTGVKTSLEVTGTPWELPAAHELCLFRAIQEGMVNALRHGGASHIRAAVSYTPSDVSLTIEDDGRGTAAPGAGGLGLTGIRERTAMLGGEVSAGPAPDGLGFRLQVWLPR